ncbi:MAG: MBL fold metallo-hydrolase [Clostridiales bacterium]|nr:MBL fold metallo-hydrolase [Clostridiales bacterium]
MELIIIGCDGSYPSANGACSGFLVRYGQEALLLDCGTGVLGKLTATMDPARLSAIVLTHWHNDHASDLLTLKYYLEISKQSLPLYAPAGPHPLGDLAQSRALDRRDLAPGFVIGGFAVSAVSVSHPVPAFAVRVSAGGKRLVYTGDTSRVDPLPAFSKGADVLICDAAFTSAQWNPDMPHLSAEKAAELALQADVGTLILSHCPPYNDAQTLLREASAVFPRARSAYNGMRLTL